MDGRDDVRAQLSGTVLGSARRTCGCVVGEGEHRVLHVVSVEVCPAEPRDGGAAVDRTTNDRGTTIVVVFKDGRGEASFVAGGEGRIEVVLVEAGGALHRVPTKVLARIARVHDVELFLYVLSDIADVEFSGASVEVDAVGVAEPHAPDFGECAGEIPRGARVAAGAIRRDTEDRTGERVRVLAMAVWIPAPIVLRGAAGVAERDVEIAVGAEGDRAAFVVRVILVDGQKDTFGIFVRGIGRRTHRVLGDDGVARWRFIVVDVKEPV